jgi:hypothetical protein
MNCGQGVAQTHGTCWFYTILNGLLLSEGGQKLLYEKMIHFYKGLTPQEKAFFRDGIDAPCPRGRNFKPIYFYKFLDQYFCFMSGPRSIKIQAGLSPQLLNNAGLNVHLNTGSWSIQHFVPLLRRLGFEESEYQSLNTYEELSSTVARKPKIIVSKFRWITRPTTIRGYELMCACINLYPTHAKIANNKETGHAVAGYVCNGIPYVIDSNFLQPMKCKWWDYRDMEPTFEKINKMYKNKFESYQISYSVYVRRSTLHRIHPACLLKYKNANVKSTRKTPAVQSAIKRQNKRSSLLQFFFPKKKSLSLSPSVLPVPNSKSPVRTRSRGVGRPRKRVPYSRLY